MHAIHLVELGDWDLDGVLHIADLIYLIDFQLHVFIWLIYVLLYVHCYLIIDIGSYL